MPSLNYTPVFEANLKAYKQGHRVIANEGSSRSSKSYSLAQLLSSYIPIREKKAISIVSPSLPHLKRGARRDFINAIQSAGLYRDAWFNKTDNIYQYPNGSYVEFFGVEDSGKVHGPSRDILWINEANLIPREIYTQLAIRTNAVIFLDYNPADEYSWVYDVADKPGNIIIHSTYNNNRGNLSQEIINEIESLRDADENLWKVYGLGLRGTSAATIYTHWKICDRFPDCEEVFYGLDFGYNNPSALIKVGIKEKAIYAEELLHQTKLTTNDLTEVIKMHGLNKSSQIFCDAAEPKTIEELVRMGLKALPADKSVYDGIQKIKSMPLFITANSTNMLKEIKSYKFKLDKDSRATDEPVKYMDHAMDALRYAVYTKLNERKKQLIYAS